MRVRLQVLKVYDVDVPTECPDPVDYADRLPTTEIERSGTLIEVSTGYAERLDEGHEPEWSDDRADFTSAAWVRPPAARTLQVGGATFSLTLRGNGGHVTSNLHHETLDAFLAAGGDTPGEPLQDQFQYGRAEGAADALESFLLAAALAGLEVEGLAFRTALETTLTALEHHI
jgi:hypothetical protein